MTAWSFGRARRSVSSGAAKLGDGSLTTEYGQAEHEIGRLYVTACSFSSERGRIASTFVRACFGVNARNARLVAASAGRGGFRRVGVGLLSVFGRRNVGFRHLRAPCSAANHATKRWPGRELAGRWRAVETRKEKNADGLCRARERMTVENSLASPIIAYNSMEAKGR